MNIYSTGAVTRVVNDLADKTPTYLRSRHFSTTQTSTDEFVYFDVLDYRPRIVPFVAPHMPGTVVQDRGFDTKQIKPAYVKPKSELSPGRYQKRMPGESIGGDLAPAERAAIDLRNKQQEHVNMLVTKEEVMASEVLRTGKLTVAGEGYKTQVLDFGRDGTLTDVLAGNHKWNVVHADSDPLDDLETWALRIQNLSGATAEDVTMSVDSFQAFRARLVALGKFEALFDYARASESKMEIGPTTYGLYEPKLMGSIGTFRVWTYSAPYTDENGNAQNVMPSGSVSMAAPQMEGVSAYGMIHDEKANFQAVRYFAKSWLEEDPAVRWLLSQSAPILFPYRPNASLGAVVL